MSDSFDYFVLLAGMRTGSNFLEANLNALEGVICFGEAFNPHFIGYPNRTEILGITREERDADPEALIAEIRALPDRLGGFRFFHDHDGRILERMLDDPRCAKIILNRNPLDSYVSWKIAAATGQWKLTDVKRRRETRIAFDAAEFESHVCALQVFQIEVLNRLQVTGQTAFHIAYEDLQDVEVVNGLARWLGVAARLEKLDGSLKPQNPGSISDKVSNPEEMAAALSGLDRFNLTRIPNFEPRRGAAVPKHVAAAHAPLLHMPVPGGPEIPIAHWLAALDDAEPCDLITGMNQKQLRRWKRKFPGHRSFTVLRHPLARAHSVFCARILSTGDGGFPHLRETLRLQFKLEIPEGEPGDDYSRQQHRAAFGTFLEFVRANLAGQTAVRTDGTWATQVAVLAGFAGVVPPDFILREDELSEMLPVLARLAGHNAAPFMPETPPDAPFSLAEIYDPELEDLAADVYRRDYVMFGFGAWRAPSPVSN